jgi:peptidoglycan/xylan/chitin deacetylase (PgdA/CDA1 family)
MRAFLVSIHDATPAYARETRAMIRDLAPLLGRQFSCAVVPDWHGAWPLAAHPAYCAFVREAAGELLIHGHTHRRLRGGGAVTLLTGASDELNGLDRSGTQRAIARGQHAFAEAFGQPARGFVAPAWQRGLVRPGGVDSPGVAYLLGFFTLAAGDGRAVPLATWTWDCGRWGWLGHVGHGLGRAMQALGRGVPTLALHPRDPGRGYWPTILRLIRRLLTDSYRPTTAAALLGGRGC